MEISGKVKRAVSHLDMKNRIALVVLIGVLLGMFITISRDVSLPYHVWLKGASSGAYTKGDYVLLKYDGEDGYIKNKNLIKQITCVPGERILRVKESVFCEGRWLGDILDKDINGKALPQINLDRIIPEGYYFIQGTHNRSYDSRYFGLVPETMFLRKLYPVAEFFEGLI